MRLLLDTHVFIWLMLDSKRLSQAAIDAIRDPDNRVCLSAASAWELAIKQSLGKLQLPAPAPEWVPLACQQGGIELMHLSADAALRVHGLPWHHRDPFDRLLIAQAAQGLTVVTHDRAFKDYDLSVLWA